MYFELYFTLLNSDAFACLGEREGSFRLEVDLKNIVKNMLYVNFKHDRSFTWILLTIKVTLRLV